MTKPIVRTHDISTDTIIKNRVQITAKTKKIKSLTELN